MKQNDFLKPLCYNVTCLNLNSFFGMASVVTQTSWNRLQACAVNFHFIEHKYVHVIKALVCLFALTLR